MKDKLETSRNILTFLEEEGVNPAILKQIRAFLDTYPMGSAEGIPSPRYAYYGKEIWEQALTAVLEPEKERSAQSVSSSVYLMSHVSCRAILVECGFVSNPEEAGLLQQPAYQRKLAMTLAACYLTADSTREGGSFV